MTDTFVLVGVRPDFGPNRAEANHLRPGVVVRLHHEHLSLVLPEQTVTSMPYRDDACEILADVWWVDLDGHRHSASDMGVIPYPSGGWNPWNWCELVEVPS